MTKKITTLFFIHNDTHILLGMKKRGFGEGRWNGFGGKVEEGESVDKAAEREIKEEAGIIVKDIEKRGILEFYYEDKDVIMETHIFTAINYEGIIIETDEMKPQWFNFEQIPLDKMWSDDFHWMPLLLNGKNFNGKFYFDDKDTITHHELIEI